jgi:hypothetical protein
MSQELKTFTIELKSLDQEIGSPVIAGAGDVNGCTLRVVFTQKAGCQLCPNSKVYLNWIHQDKKVKGYNVLSKVSDTPSTWEIHWPKGMLFEGTVLCRLEIVDDVSIAPSNNFTVHVLQNPNDGSSFVVTDDYSDFQQAILDLTTLKDDMLDEFNYQKKLFEDFQLDVSDIKDTVSRAEDKAQEALDKVNDLIAGEFALYMNELDD